MEGAVADRRVHESLKLVAPRDRPGRQHERGRHVHQVSGGEPQGGHRRGVGPLEIVDRDQQWPLQGQTLEPLGEAFDDPELGRSLVDETRDLGAERIGRRHPAAERVGQWSEGPGALELVGGGVKRSTPCCVRQDLGQEPALADPWFALDEHDLVPGRSPAGQPLAHCVELRRSADQTPLSML